MARRANPEQLLAIEHTGGVLLRAGAGSGKTFVLVEHILYLTQVWITEFKSSPFGTFEDFIRSRYAQVVMMTFTKKAAGEMSIRLTEKFQEKASEEQVDQVFWKTANELLPVLMVTTIDGFCKKLISQGYFPHLSTEADIIFDTQRTDQVRELVEAWFAESSDAVEQSILDILIREKKQLLEAFTHVFSDPGLRLLWKKFDVREIHPSKVGALLHHSFVLNELPAALAAVHNLEIPVDRPSAFERIVAGFQATNLPEVDGVDKLILYRDLFENSGRIATTKKEPAQIAAKDGLAALKKWVAKWESVAIDYEGQYDQKIHPWMTLCLSIFNYIEAHLDPNLGMTFGDIEYLVSLGLENSHDRERIQRTFSYFIVDEFQDTSDIQFRIIQNLIGGDYRKLFCVGDAKQAIYGFRGGELSVFQNCAELVPIVRTLANNYRSLPEIISINNSLFRTLLPLGYNFQGSDPFSVSAEDQNIPPEVAATESGCAEIYTASLNPGNDREYSAEEMNRLEAIVIADAIQKERSSSHNVCTVLYSKLRPSNELIRALMERKIGFTAQFKIDLLDDPILGIFLGLLRRQFDSNQDTKVRYPLFLFKSYFDILGLAARVTEADLAEFDQNVTYWGLVTAYRKFLHKLKITNENSDINLATIQTISDLYLEDPEAIMNQLASSDNDRLSLELRYGENSGKVQIMSAHASKGLEFDCVYLGGIYTNGREQHSGSLFGDLPGSFQWYMDLTLRDRRKSPMLVYEDELARLKNYSEAKRLFYVACTRAKKKLVWVDFAIPDKAFAIWPNCWISGLRTWLSDGRGKENVIEVPLPDFDSVKLLSAQSAPQLPLFFHDPMGIHAKGGGTSELLVAAEMSVTKLNALLDCPRKFYLATILKMPVLSPPGESPSQSPSKEEVLEEELASLVRSTSERGTYIHAQIAQGIERHFVVPRESFGTELQAPIQWALEMLKPLVNQYEFAAEKQLKFRFFNFMISGIPDLYLLPKGDLSAQVWDFKTGKITHENLAHYWLQLSVYAYALFMLGLVEKSKTIKLVLCFVDQKKLLEESINFDTCVAKLYPVWRSQNEPWKVNLDHCGQCSYGSICPR